MGLFDSEDTDDFGDMLGETMNELMSRAREAQYMQRWYSLANGAYSKIAAIEPELRTDAQNTITAFMEELSHQTICSLGWCDKQDDPFHVEEHKIVMRAAAMEVQKEWEERCSTGDPSYAEVNQYIDNLIKGI